MQVRKLGPLAGFLLGCLSALAGFSQLATAQTPDQNEWTWMGGSQALPLQPVLGTIIGGVSGVYGTLGTPAPTNAPGSRQMAMSWTDLSGNLWLFGGQGYDAAGSYGELNDLWVFDPSTNEWTWISGSSAMPCSEGICSGAGVYGALGVPAAGNIPLGRDSAATWTDSNGHLWLFGGEGQFSISPGLVSGGEFNDLWEFNPATNEWAWAGGTNPYANRSGNPLAIYGTLGVPSPGNNPGARIAAAAWTDRSGNFWLFGGAGAGYLNDLWEFNPSTNEWAWMSGSDTVPSTGFGDGGQPGVYGTLGTASSANTPGGRENSSSWTDKSGNLWLFGGLGYDANDVYGFLNDLWEFNPSTNEWAWTRGSSTVPYDNDAAGAVVGTLGTPAAGNTPIGMQGPSGWTDKAGNLWLFGGSTTSDVVGGGLQNVLWEFNPSTDEWTWIGGNPGEGGNTGQLPGVFGRLGDADPGNIPGARYNATGWTDINGHLWLFGGYGDISGFMGTGTLNDLWKYAPPTASIYPAMPPIFSVAAGTYTTPQSVTISDIISEATFYYTTNGSTPTTNSAVYSGPISVSSSETLQAIATAADYTTSAVASATYTVNLPDFTVAASPASFTVIAGQSATTTISITPVNSFNSSVLLICSSGLPAGASCSFSPATVAPSGAAASTTLTVNTSASIASLHCNQSPILPASVLAVLFCCFGWRTRQRLHSLLLVFLCVAALSMLNGCGGGAGGSTSGGGGSQPITSTITVTATSGPLTHSATFLLTVN